MNYLLETKSWKIFQLSHPSTSNTIQQINVADDLHLAPPRRSCLLNIMFGAKHHISNCTSYINLKMSEICKNVSLFFLHSRSQYLEFCFAWIYLEMVRLVHISTFEFCPSSYLSCSESLCLLAKFFLLHAVSSESHFLSWLTICLSVLFRWVSKQNELILSDPVSESI